MIDLIMSSQSTHNIKNNFVKDFLLKCISTEKAKIRPKRIEVFERA